MTEALVDAQGTQYRVGDIGDGVVGKALRTGEPYEAKVLYHIKRRGFQGHAVDAGASIGNHALWFALGCRLRVSAFEPYHYTELVNNVKRNADQHPMIDTYSFGLSNESGMAEYVGKGQFDPCPSGTYKLVPLDTLHLKDVCLMKVDVEGMEVPVLLGAQDTIAEYRPTLYVEAGSDAAHDELGLLLRDWKYKYRRSYGATPLEEWDPC
jgi:FkbM family methyltransferase